MRNINKIYNYTYDVTDNFILLSCATNLEVDYFIFHYGVL